MIITRMEKNLENGESPTKSRRMTKAAAKVRRNGGIDENFPISQNHITMQNV